MDREYNGFKLRGGKDEGTNSKQPRDDYDRGGDRECAVKEDEKLKLKYTLQGDDYGRQGEGRRGLRGEAAKRIQMWRQADQEVCGSGERLQLEG